MTLVIEEDRGLGTAYERVRIYELMDRWATEYGIESALEGPFDGMAGVPGVHLVGLARRGTSVVSVLRTRAQADIAKAIYRSAGGDSGTVLVADSAAPLRDLPRADMVLSYHALELVEDWREYLAALSAVARKVLVVAVRNPRNWGVVLERGVRELPGLERFQPPETWYMDTVAPVLWELGRVREHVYFDSPWWPDLQLGQVVGKARALLPSRGPRESRTARYSYRAGRWPYFGGEGWEDELGPALRRHPHLEHSTAWVQRFAAHLHAFVVDVRAQRLKGLDRI